MIKYITRRPLWFNILIAFGIIVVIFLIFMLSLNWITRHGESKTVPAVTGKNISEVVKLLDEKGFELIVQDSVYYDSLPPGFVLKQVPEADEVVKVNRTVYVIINRFIAPDVSMPNLLGSTLKNAEFTLEKMGLKLGDTTMVEDFAAGSIKEMKVNGKDIRPGDKIKVGSRIDLVISAGLGVQDMAVPNLIGKTFADARIILMESGLTIELMPIPGAVRDVDNGYIWKQEPTARTSDGIQVRIRSGQTMTVWLQSEPLPEDTSRSPQPTEIPD